MEYFDSHCHLDPMRFGAELPAVLERAREAGVVGMAVIGTRAADSEAAAALAAREPGLVAAALRAASLRPVGGRHIATRRGPLAARQDHGAPSDLVASTRTPPRGELALGGRPIAARAQADAVAALAAFQPVDYDKWVDVMPGVRAR